MGKTYEELYDNLIGEKFRANIIRYSHQSKRYKYYGYSHNVEGMEKANDLLDGNDSVSSRFGTIRYYEDELIAKCNKGLKLLDTFGIRTFWDLQQNQVKHGTEEWQMRMMQLEMRVSKIEEYRKIAFFHHLIFIKE